MMIRRLIQLASRKQMGINNTQASIKSINSNTNIASLHSNFLHNRFSSKRAASSKSTHTPSFHKVLLENERSQLSSNNGVADEDCPELNELKDYFLSFEQDEIDHSEDFLDEEEGGLTQFDLNEGGESDFSEEFEKAIQNSSKKANERSLFDQKFSNMNRSLTQKGLFGNTANDIQSNQDLLVEESQEKKGLMFLRKNKNQPTFLEKKFGLNISSEPRERQADLQKFVLKTLQLLNSKQIQHFIQIIEYFKSKLTSHNFKKSQNVHEEFFMRQVFKLFENNKAEELMDLFLKCDLIDLNINLFTNNVADYEKSYEMKNKHKQFDAFSKSNQPNGNHFILNELAEKYNNLDYQKYSSLQNDEDIEDQIDELDIDSIDKSNPHSQKLYNISDTTSRLIKYEEETYSSQQTFEHSKQATQTQKQDGAKEKGKALEGINNDLYIGELNMDKEHQLFQKVTMYEYEKNGSIQKLDSKLFDQLSSSAQKNSASQKYDIFKTDSFSQANWNSSLLEEEYFPSTQCSNGSLNDRSPNSFIDNFILEPTLYSQQKIMQIGRQFENQFDHNLNLIDDINNDAMLSAHANLPQISNAASTTNIKLQEKDFNELLNLESERAAISTKKINRIHNNKMVLKQTFEVNIQQQDEIIILKQEENLIPKKFEKSNWVYMYHLPYDINEVPNYTTYIKKFVESSFGEIEEINFFNYRDFFEIERIRSKDDPIERGLRDSLQEQYIQTNITPTSLSTSEKPKKKATQSKSSKVGFNNLSDEELLEHIYLNNQINPDFCQKTLKRTEKILEKIQNKKERRFNRSYAMIKFKKYESKERVLSQDIRLFGVQNFNEMFYFDDADFKKALIISKIPWGINIQHLINKLNQQFKQNGLKHIKISVSDINLKKVLTNYFLILKMHNFKDGLDIVNAFKKHEFTIENNQLACHHSYGSLKQGPSGFYEVTDNVQHNYKQELIERVKERKVFEIWNIYKENTGYLNTIRGGLHEENLSENIEINQDELEDYEEYDNQLSQIQSNLNIQQINSPAGFSKTQQYFQQKSISSDYGYYDPSEQNEELFSNELLEELKNKKK